MELFYIQPGKIASHLMSDFSGISYVNENPFTVRLDCGPDFVILMKSASARS
jgi:hypothetical protein